MSGQLELPRCQVCGASLADATEGAWCPGCALAGAFSTDVERLGPGASDGVLFRVPGHAVLAELGRGAAGIVYRARQEQPAREVALKILRPHEMGSAESRARFRLEAATVAGLDHPVILPVLTVGEHDGLPYFTMKLCAGSLAERLENYRGRWRDIAALLALLAEAVHHAHAHGVLHRDLKPGNVLFDEADRPFISDFGLAKLIEPAAGRPATQPLLVLGTPGYLAPEVLAGGAAQATIAADVFALGAILHELLTGSPPPAGHAADAARPGVPRDLAVICAHALAAEPGRRYASAETLAEDLRAWLAGRPIAARSVSALGRGWAWARRNPALAVLTLALGTTLLGATVVLSFKNRQLDAALAQAQAAGRRAELNLADALLAQAQAVRDSGRIGQRYQALELLGRAGQINPGFAVLSEAAAALARPDLRVETTLPAFPQNNIFDELDFSPDLAWWAEGAAQGGVDIRGTADVSVLRHLPGPPEGLPWFVRFSGDGQRVLAIFNNEHLRVWDLATQAELFSTGGSPAHSPRGALSPVADDLAWIDGTGALRVRSLGTGREHVLGSIGRNVRRLSFSPDGSALALVTEAGLEVWDIATAQRRWRWDGILARLEPAWSDRGDSLAVSLLRPFSEIILLDPATGQPRQHLKPDSGNVSLLAFFPGGHVLASVTTSGELTLWDWVREERLVRTPVGRNALRVSRDGRRLGVAVSYQELGVMAVADNDVVRPWRPGQSSQLATHSIAFSRDGHRAATVSRSEVRWWDVDQGREAAVLPFSSIVDATRSVWVFFDPASSGLLLNLGDGVVRRLEGPAGPAAVLRELSFAGEHELRGFARGGRDWVLEATTVNHVEVWPDGDSSRARAVTGPAVSTGESWDTTMFSPDGRWVATSSVHPTAVLVWDATTAKLAAQLPVTRRVGGDFSPDGRWFVLGTDQSYTLYDTATWKAAANWPVRLVDDYRGWASFSPDGRWLALQVGSRTLELRQTADFKAVIRLELAEMQDRNELEWASDSRRLCVVCRGHSVYEWNLPALSRELERLGLGRLPGF